MNVDFDTYTQTLFATEYLFGLKFQYSQNDTLTLSAC